MSSPTRQPGTLSASRDPSVLLMLAGRKRAAAARHRAHAERLEADAIILERRRADVVGSPQVAAS
jgi:hypothetical protein